MYLIKVMPFEDRTDNIIEIFNESCIFLLLSALITYTDNSTIDPQTSSNLGFALIGLILFMIGVNVLLFLYSNLLIIYHKAYQPLKEKLSKWINQKMPVRDKRTNKKMKKKELVIAITPNEEVFEDWDQGNFHEKQA